MASHDPVLSPAAPDAPLEPEFNPLVDDAETADATDAANAPRTRRNLLSAAAGGLGALVVGSLVGAKPAEAAAGKPLIMGVTSNSAGTANTRLTTKTTSSAYQVVQTGVGTAIAGSATATTGTTRGVWGRAVAPNGDGVLATNAAAAAGTGSALRAQGGKNTGVLATSENIAISGTGTYAGIQGAGAYGGIFSGTSVGAYASATTYGVYGAATTYGLFGAGETGVYGSGTTYGVAGSASTGVFGTSGDPNGNAVLGDGGQYGVHGVNGRTAGVRGDSGYVGTWGQGTSYGVYGLSTDNVNVAYGVFGQASNGSSWAVYAQGNMRCTGTLSKSAGSFQIDHPLDPDNKWLSHSFVESPDMMNVYNGVVDLDGVGKATVKLPGYFGALNRDYRYQLTAIGAAAPSLHVAEEISRNRFVIAGGTPHGRVSWQVTGIRQDAYAKAHPIVVEQAKNADEAGARMFVPKGSKARQWMAHPARPREQAPAHKPADAGRLAIPAQIPGS